jgi:hypothetical protein
VKRRTLLSVVAVAAAASIGGLLVIRGGGNLTETDLAPIKALSSLEEALQWRERAETASAQFADPEAARRAGYFSVEPPGLSGWNHLARWSAVEDDVVLDPDAPEALLYRVEDGQWTLVAEVFLMPKRYTFTNTPRIADGAGSWHNHPTACVAGDPFTDPELGRIDINCDSGHEFPRNLMLHAWVVPYACGPFSAAIVETGAPELVAEGISGLDENGKIPECDPELAERVWPGITG